MAKTAMREAAGSSRRRPKPYKRRQSPLTPARQSGLYGDIRFAEIRAPQMLVAHIAKRFVEGATSMLAASNSCGLNESRSACPTGRDV